MCNSNKLSRKGKGRRRDGGGEEGEGLLQRNFGDVDYFIVHKPRGQDPEYSLSARHKRMQLSGDGHESETRLIVNPAEDLRQMKVLCKQTL